MEEEKFFFYIPPGSFTSFELLSICYKPPDENPVKLQIQYNDQTIDLPDPKKDGEMLSWSSDSAQNFSFARASNFNLIANGVSIPVDFNDLTLISSPKYFDKSEIKNIFVFCFISGFYARKSDFEMLTLKAPSNLKFISQNRLDTYQSICKDYKDKLSKFEDIQNNKLNTVLSNRQIYQEKTSQSRVQKYEEYKESTKETPVLNLNYPLEQKDKHLQTSNFSSVFQTSINFSTESTSLSFRMPTSRSNPDLKEMNRFSDITDLKEQNSSDNSSSPIKTLHQPTSLLSHRRSSLSAKAIEESLSKFDPMTTPHSKLNSKQIQQNENHEVELQNKNLTKSEHGSAVKKNNFFPENRQGPRSPSQDEIKMFLSELPLIFPIDVEKRLFCNISIDDPDIQASKMLLFNVIHFLSLFAEFTGIIYHYRIGMAEGGWYKLEDRITGVEVKREITSKNVMMSPLRVAVMNCLKKIVFEFNLKTRDHDDMIHLLDSIIHFYKILD